MAPERRREVLDISCPDKYQHTRLASDLIQQSTDRLRPHVQNHRVLLRKTGCEILHFAPSLHPLVRAIDGKKKTKLHRFIQHSGKILLELERPRISMWLKHHNEPSPRRAHAQTREASRSQSDGAHNPRSPRATHSQTADLAGAPSQGTPIAHRPEAHRQTRRARTAQHSESASVDPPPARCPIARIKIINLILRNARHSSPRAARPCPRSDLQSQQAASNYGCRVVIRMIPVDVQNRCLLWRKMIDRSVTLIHLRHHPRLPVWRLGASSGSETAPQGYNPLRYHNDASRMRSSPRSSSFHGYRQPR